MSKSILIVDDDRVNVMLVASALEDTYEILTALNGNEAIRQVVMKHPDLVILDVMMPGLDGFDVCRMIKADKMYADIPVIFMSAVDSAIGENMGTNSGGVDYLPKPVDTGLLKRLVRKYIEPEIPENKEDVPAQSP